MLQNLNFTQLYFFKMVVDQGSITKAATIGCLTSSAISMQIKSLEAYLGKELFSRKKRALSLTKDGTIVYDYANHLFRISSELLATIKDEASAKTAKLDIGVQHDVPKNLIAQITSFIFSHFNRHISILTKRRDQLVVDLMNQDIDLAVLNYPPVVNDRPIIHGKCILRSPIIFAGEKRFLHLKDKDLRAFVNVPMILPTPSLEIRRKLEVEFARQELEMTVIAEVEDTMIMKNMAIAGNGVVPIMKAAITNYVKTGQLHILHELDEVEDEIWLVTTKARKPNQVFHSIANEFSFLKSLIATALSYLPIFEEVLIFA